MRKDVQDKLVRELLSSDSPVVEALRESIERELATLLDITKIDMGGDSSVERIGQETLARRRAYDTLRNIFSTLGLGLKESLEQDRNKSFR